MTKTVKKICLVATREELQKFNSLKRIFQRRTDSDMLRFLINNGEKILSVNTPVDVKYP